MIESFDKTKKFRPSLWMSICTFLALIVLITLGTWQIQRLNWKQDLIEKIEGRMGSEPIALPTAYSQELRYKPVEVTGQFLPEKQDLLFGRTHKGSTGYLALVPFQTTDGRLVLINRGWVSNARKNISNWQAGDFEGQTQIVGLLQQGVVRGAENKITQSEVSAEALFKIDPALVAKRKGLTNLEPFYLDQIAPQNLGDYPVLLAKKVEVTNNHLQYALTWFAFALILLVIFIMMSFRPSKKVAKT